MHFEQMKITVTKPGEHLNKPKLGQERLTPSKVTHYDMTKWIENAGIDEDTKKELLKEIARYPANTMRHYYTNIHKHIARIHKKRKENDTK